VAGQPPALGMISGSDGYLALLALPGHAAIITLDGDRR
jgi:hypothetical protein